MRQIIILAVLGFMFLGCGAERSETPGRQEVTPAPKSEVPEEPKLRQQDPQNFDRADRSIGQLVYVPVYSHIYQRNRTKTFNLTTTLSIRNADPFRPLTLTRVAYYDSKGNIIQEYIDSGEQIEPLASTSYVIEEEDLRGGVGANFLVRWQSDEPVFPPVIEAVNISTSQQQGISFLSVGRVLQERSATQLDNQ